MAALDLAALDLAALDLAALDLAALDLAARGLRWGHSLAVVGLGVSVAACTLPRSERSSPSATAQASAASATASARQPVQLPLADERVDIPGGGFRCGSVPGEPGRQPDLEPRSFELELGPYQIDKLPYPNDPARRPLTDVPRREATRLCAERGQRLCTELEWERACKGPASDTYPGGATWDARCPEHPESCASGFEVLSMGGSLREWTMSDVVPVDPGLPRRASVRGAPGSAPGPEHRCAHRQGVDSTITAPDLGFRCCRGAPNGAVVPEPRLGPTFRKFKLPAERLEKLLLAHPRTARLASKVKFFREPDGIDTVLGRGPGDRKGFAFTVMPLVWNPVAGSEYLVLTARSGDNVAFVLAYWVMGDDSYQLASSFVMENEPGPVALAYSDSIRPRLHFSPCWGCPGETGKILFRNPDSVVILQP